MPIDAPTFPGEQRLDLTSAIVTSAFCQNPANAFDTDPTTAAIFSSVITVSSLVSSLSTNWIDSGIVIYPGQSLTVECDGTIYWDPGTANGGGASEPGSGAKAYQFPASLAVLAAYGLAILLLPDGVVPSSSPKVGGTQYTAGIYGLPYTASGSTVNATFTAAQILAGNPPALLPGHGWRVWFIVNDDEPLNNSASFSVTATSTDQASSFAPTRRFVRAAWDTDAFITRVRLNMTGPGCPTSAVAMESSLGGIENGPPGADIPIPYIPLPADGTTHEIVLDPPVFGRSVAFFPDYLAENGAETGAVTLDLFEVYALEGAQDMGSVTIPAGATRWSQVGVQAATIWPWNNGAGPFTNTQGSTFGGLQSCAIGIAITNAVVLGGETMAQIGAYGVERKVSLKLTAEVCDLRALAILLGGTIIVDPADGNGQEVQYYAENYTDRNPYFRMSILSTNGDGSLSLLTAKAKVTGNVSYNLDRTKVTDLEFDCDAFWDYTYVRQDGSVGGDVEWLHGAGGETSMHS